jgi:hypothetical protein
MNLLVNIVRCCVQRNMELEFDYRITQQNETDENLIQNIKFLKRNYDCVQIGITNSPAFQALKHDKKNWAKMIVKYQFDCVNKLERFEKFIINQDIELINNELDRSNNSPYYFYFLLK